MKAISMKIYFPNSSADNPDTIHLYPPAPKKRGGTQAGLGLLGTKKTANPPSEWYTQAFEYMESAEKVSTDFLRGVIPWLLILP
jgi:hypothetical protein